MDRSGRRAKLGSRASGTMARPSAPPPAIDPEEFTATVGESIRAARQERGWTQVELAQASGLSPNYVARLERGELGPSLFVARQICDALEIDVEALFSPSSRERKTGRRRLV